MLHDSESFSSGHADLLGVFRTSSAKLLLHGVSAWSSRVWLCGRRLGPLQTSWRVVSFQLARRGVLGGVVQLRAGPPSPHVPARPRPAASARPPAALPAAPVAASTGESRCQPRLCQCSAAFHVLLTTDLPGFMTACPSSRGRRRGLQHLMTAHRCEIRLRGRKQAFLQGAELCQGPAATHADRES